jgi:hypothetical protein
MALFKEREQEQAESVERIPESPEFPEKLVKEAGIETVETAAPANLKDGKRDLVISPETQAQTIVIPKSQEELATLAKGSKEESSTWFGASWLRALKMAIFRGIKIIFGKGP